MFLLITTLRNRFGRDEGVTTVEWLGMATIVLGAVIAVVYLMKKRRESNQEKGTEVGHERQ